MTELHNVRWNHPVYGRIAETICEDHERDLLRALHTLGIGCVARPETERDTCDRCAHPSGYARDWIASRARPR